MTSSGFYRAFEDRYRGSRELIRQRLQAYLPFAQPLRTLYFPATAIDLGCGRGEWLELLQSEGFEPHGVDLDSHMLAACTERGLSVSQGDALAYLQSQENESQCVVSGFHIAEHLAFDDLERLVIESLRVLKPGGVLVLETPNPENLVVGTSNFYLDPTHVRPIPPLLLAFLPELHGFCRTSTVRLQESAELHDRRDVTLMEVFRGASPDYAIVAQKQASPEILAPFNAAFSATYGIKLSDLAQRYDHQLKASMDALEQRVSRTEIRMDDIREISGVIQPLQDQVARLTEQLLSASQKLQAAVAENKSLENRAGHLQDRVNALEQSLSWRLTAPLRMSGKVADSEALRQVARKPIWWVLERPDLADRINRHLMRLPWLHTRLKALAEVEAEVPAEQPEHKSFEEFIKHKLHVESVPESEFVGVDQESKKIYLPVMDGIAEFSGINANADLIHAIRNGAEIRFSSPVMRGDQQNLEILVRHVFLALLKRHSRRTDEELNAKLMLAGKSISAVINGVKSSEEYRKKNILPDI